MPYITEPNRLRLIKGTSDPVTPGELNYQITSLVHEYIQQVGGLGYDNINEAIGVLECAKLELYRQIAAPYEDIKKIENGSVSNLDEEKR